MLLTEVFVDDKRCVILCGRVFEVVSKYTTETPHAAYERCFGLPQYNRFLINEQILDWPLDELEGIGWHEIGHSLQTDEEADFANNSRLDSLSGQFKLEVRADDYAAKMGSRRGLIKALTRTKSSLNSCDWRKKLLRKRIGILKRTR